MSDSLTTLQDKLQALMMDDGTLFPDATCTAALRQALRTFNSLLPRTGATTIDVVSGQLVYELTEALASATVLNITGIYLEDPTGGDNDTPLQADVYVEDERYFFRLKTASGGTTMIVRYSCPHIINGLDSEVLSTLSTFQEPTLLDAAAATLARMAAAGTVESNNLDPRTSQNYALAADHFQKAFDFGIAGLKMQRTPAQRIPAARTWQDPWHTY